MNIFKCSPGKYFTLTAEHHTSGIKFLYKRPKIVRKYEKTSCTTRYMLSCIFSFISLSFLVITADKL